MKHHADKLFLFILVALSAAGFLIFTSASIGLLARNGARFGHVAGRQFLSLAMGGGLAYFASRLRLSFLKRHAFLILITSILLTIFVFVPGIGFSYGGAKRWIDIAGFSFQPSEALKIGFVVYAAALFAALRDKLRSLRKGLLPLAALVGLSGLILLLQPDTDTFLILSLALLSMFLAAGGKTRHVLLMTLIGGALLGVLIFERPYLKERVLTFIDPSADPRGAGYQIQQSLLAIGSGRLTGRGFGQSIQKFSYLPEPIDDSIFAVAGEEFGFIGSVLLILLFLAFTLRGLAISSHTSDMFGGLLSLGLVILIGASAFINMAAMLGVLPLSGLPLSFVSHGGTAMLFALFEAGLVLNVSRTSNM